MSLGAAPPVTSATNQKSQDFQASVHAKRIEAHRANIADAAAALAGKHIGSKPGA